ncbi:uncharacterized protein LOC126856496 [Cataglyphis hispanica]|uniref:uncharacterized protein LOC126856496 n=1 Tax=Cataglyphis hispanica TaxID=1086592 RepID=UPI00217F46B6|nr:uncharacterized protein LOC126856496 [Cataglyphis hispanica]
MIPKSEGKEYSPLSQASPDRNISETISRNENSIDAVRSASLPHLTTTVTMTTTMTIKTPRSKVYRKTSLRNPSLNCDIIGSSILEKKSIVRYVSTAAQEKKQKRRNLAERETNVRSENKWNLEDIHITCNPLSTPYPYSTPTTATTTTTTISSKTTTESDEEPKSRSCGSFLPIFALIPHSVISFQYLSPKMKFSWWRNKIS